MHIPSDFLNCVGDNNYVISTRFNYMLHFDRLEGGFPWLLTYLVGFKIFFRQELLYVALPILVTL